MYQTAMDGCDAAGYQDTTIVAHRSNIIQPCVLATKTTHTFHCFAGICGLLAFFLCRIPFQL